VALWEAYPTHASHEGTFEFRDDGSRSLFEAVAVMTGLSPLVRELEARLAADVESAPQSIQVQARYTGTL
jgi:hypothetical protein